MRTVFHDQLDAVFDELAAICRQVETSVRVATDALLTGRSDLAEQVISGDAEIDRARERVEDTAYALLSLQAPVAGDLRIVIAALRMVSDLERMGDLSVHVAKIARLRTPNLAVPDQVRPTINKMAEVAVAMVARTAEVIRDRDVDAAAALAAKDEEMDALRRDTFAEMLGADWTAGVEPAVDVALLGRYYERIADHAVTIAGRVIFVVTGELPVAD